MGQEEAWAELLLTFVLRRNCIMDGMAKRPKDPECTWPDPQELLPKCQRRKLEATGKSRAGDRMEREGLLPNHGVALRH